MRAEAEAADDLTGPDDTESARERAVGVTLERPPVSADWRDERERERRLLRSAAGGRGATVLALAFAALTFFLGLERRPRAYKFSISDDASAGREDATGWMSFGIDLVNERALAGAGRFTQSVSAPVIVGRHAWGSEQQASREAGAQSSTRGAAAGARPME